jgi:hypothetical protein
VREGERYPPTAMPTPPSKLNLAATHCPVGRNRPHPRRWATPPNPRLNGFLTPNFCIWVCEDGFVCCRWVCLLQMGCRWLCCRWLCLLWVMPGKLVGGDGVTASWWVGNSPVVQRCEGLRVYHDGGGVTALRGIIVYFVLILIFLYFS